MMVKMMVVMVVVMVVVVVRPVTCFNEFSTINASVLVTEYENEMMKLMKNATLLTWQRVTGGNVTKEEMLETVLKIMEMRGQYEEKVMFYLQRNQRVKDTVRRRLKLAANGHLERQDALSLEAILTNMSSVYDTGEVCTNMDIEICKTVPRGIIREFSEEQDPDKLEKLWTDWHTDLAQGLAPSFKQSVAALNKAAVSVGLKDFSEEMMKTYEGHFSKTDMLSLYMDVEPLYKLLHAYVRSKLKQRFPDQHIKPRDPIPVTLLGDIFGRFWSKLFSYMKAYPDAKEANITEYIQSVSESWWWMYSWAEDRFMSMGLKPLPKSFYERSVLVEPQPWMECQPSAWDMYDHDDFRVYMCTRRTEEHLQTILHLLTHVQYFQHMSNQPYFFRKGAHEGFQEAIANLFTLVFSSPSHLYSYGFNNATFKEILNKEIQLNYLLHVGLALLPTLPYFLGLEIWRWKVYEGVYLQEEWNCEYWKLRKYYSGVLPTVSRSLKDLDMLPTHQLAHTQTGSRHFIAIFMMFQILEALCEEEGHRGPLHMCDLYGGRKAGKRLASAMSLGRSRPWPSTYQILTGSTRVSSGPLLRYFKPLRDWLKDWQDREGPSAASGWGGKL